MINLFFFFLVKKTNIEILHQIKGKECTLYRGQSGWSFSWRVSRIRKIFRSKVWVRNFYQSNRL